MTILSGNILEVKDLKVYFPVRKSSFLDRLNAKKKQYIHAVDDVSLSIKRHETFAIVGESGSGKTTLGRALTLMVKPISGEIILDDQNILRLKPKDAKKIVRKKIQMIFQDPFSSLNPRKTVEQAIKVPLKIRIYRQNQDVEKRITELLKLTGLNENFRLKYPHQLSGGQRQRVVIARAMAADPEFLVADEPVSKLDLSIKAQIINLFSEIQKKMGLTILFIAHDLRMAKHISTTIAVMYHGRIMELSSSHNLFKNPTHPYTKALLNSIPVLNPLHRKSYNVKKQKVQDIGLVDPPAGCRYFLSCPKSTSKCERSYIRFEEVEENHWVACRNL